MNFEQAKTLTADEFRDMTQPWGGFKQSGTIRDKCLETLLAVPQTKSVWVNLG